MRKIDRSGLLGQSFGKWLVIGFPKTQNLRHPFVLCRCECGREKDVHINNLISGKSSGCRLCAGMTGSSNPAWKGHKDIPHTYFTILKRSAAARNLSVAITIEDLQVEWERCGGVCALTGLPIKMDPKSGIRTASLDRIDPDSGYEPGNIQWVHKDVNLMRNKFGVAYFVEICRLVAEKNQPDRLIAAGS